MRIEYYEKGARGFKKVVERAPGDLEELYRLNDAYVKLAGLLLSEGESLRAKQAYSEALAANVQIIKIAPNDPAAQRFLVPTYEGLSALAKADGDLERAEEYGKRAEECRKKAE